MNAGQMHTKLKLHQKSKRTLMVIILIVPKKNRESLSRRLPRRLKKALWKKLD